jgi:hypothetical protein
MSKMYLEILEILTKDEKLIKQAQVVRIEAADRTDALNKLPEQEALFVGRNYIKRIHTCFHQEKLPCQVEVLA